MYLGVKVTEMATKQSAHSKHLDTGRRTTISAAQRESQMESSEWSSRVVQSGHNNPGIGEIRRDGGTDLCGLGKFLPLSGPRSTSVLLGLTGPSVVKD